MTAGEVQSLVARTLDQYVFEPPPSGSTIGISWPAEKVYQHREDLRAHLVMPSIKNAELRDTYAQVIAPIPAFAEVWVVAKFGPSWLFFDPVTTDFGIAQKSKSTDTYVTIGVRGDLVGVFCAA